MASSRSRPKEAKGRRPAIPDYTFPLDCPIGEGAFGEVWFALFKEDQPRAVKIFKRDMLRGDLWKSEFEKLKALDEPPGIVTLYDRGETEDGRPFVAMRLMADETQGGRREGRTLMRRIEAGDFDLETRWRLVFEIAETLANMHRERIVHCDVKPTNVLLSSGEEPRAVLCDFGQSIGEGYSPEGATGTFLYASPEQLMGDEDQIQGWDVYSFGVTAWQLLTGELPRLRLLAAELKEGGDAQTALERTGINLPIDSLSFGSSLDRELIPKMMVEAVEAEREIAIPQDLVAVGRRGEIQVLLRCLALAGDRHPRYTSMREVVGAFDLEVRKRTVAAESRKKRIFATLMVFGLVAAALAGWQWKRAEGSRRSAEIYAGRASEAATEQERLAKEAASQRDTAENLRSVAEEQRGEAERLRVEAETQKGIAEKEKENAQKSETVALVARATAEGLINNMLYDLKNRLEPLGRVDLLDQVSTQAEAYFQQIPEGQRDDGFQRERSTMLNNRGEVFFAMGSYDRALEAFEEAKEVREGLVKADPDDGGRRRDLSVSEERMGDVLAALGDLEGAEARFRACLEIREEGSAEPGDPGRVRDVVVALSKLSDIRARSGDIPGATTYSERSLALLRKLAEESPEVPGIRRDLAAALAAEGDLLRLGGKAEAAKGRYEESVSLLKGLVAASDPDDMIVRGDFAAVLFRVGEGNAGLGENSAALASYSEALPILERIARKDPANPARQRNLALAMARMGEILAAGGSVGEARPLLEKSSALFTPLVAPDGVRGDWLEDAQSVEIALGDLLAGAGDRVSAQNHYSRSLSLARRRFAAEKDDGDVLGNLVVSLYKLGRCSRHLASPGAKAGARRYLGEALELLSDPAAVGLESWETVIRGELERIEE